MLVRQVSMTRRPLEVTPAKPVFLGRSLLPEPQLAPRPSRVPLQPRQLRAKALRTMMTRSELARMWALPYQPAPNLRRP